MSLTYRDAGVDIDAGDALVDRIKPLAEKTFRSGVLGSLGGFGGLFAIPPGIKEPILVSGTDGVGTKLKLAFATGRHNTIGIDLVAMCVNDIAVTGAEPLFFLDYFGCGRLDVAVAEQVVAGIAEGCKQAGCALIGGETAELPGMYADGEYDLAGFSVGVVERANLIDGLKQVKPGDVAIGLASSGLHSNGYSLARKVFDGRLAEFADALLAPTRIYVRAIQAALRAGTVHGIAHITGGGLVENPPRVLPAGTQLRLNEKSWPLPPIFSEIAKAGVENSEMRRTFNMGLGLILLAPVSDVRAIQAACANAGEQAYMIGEVVAQKDSSQASFVEFV